MKVLHVVPHLGGGVGKAHAALRKALGGDIDQTFALLEKPKDTRHSDALKKSGAKIMVAETTQIARWAKDAAIVQIEWWDHPRLRQVLAEALPMQTRLVVWAHQAGPFPREIMRAADRFVFTSPISLNADRIPAQSLVINSGFGFDPEHRKKHYPCTPRIAYLGTVREDKMCPVFFDVMDATPAHATIWGEPHRNITDYAEEMRHPERITFAGFTRDPLAALKAAEIFFYPLNPTHYGTGENALVEAMSLGLCPVVLDNPAEREIVQPGTGFICTSAQECAETLRWLLDSPQIVAETGRAAAAHIAATRTASLSADAFSALWRTLWTEPKRTHPSLRSLDTSAQAAG